MGDEAFIRAILEDPRNDTPRLVYADWLEEQGDPVSAARAEFLRLTVELADPATRRKRRKKRKERLQQLAAGLDTDWLAVVSRLAIENCYRKRAEEESRPMHLFRFDYLCDRRWDDLRPTDNQAVRFCDGCKQNVHYCDTITAARQHAWARHCVAVDLGVIRRKQDLEPARAYLGRPSPAMLQEERERMQPDPVSAERERRKPEKQQGDAPQA